MTVNHPLCDEVSASSFIRDSCCYLQTTLSESHPLKHFIESTCTLIDHLAPTIPLIVNIKHILSTYPSILPLTSDHFRSLSTCTTLIGFFSSLSSLQCFLNRVIDILPSNMSLSSLWTHLSNTYSSSFPLHNDINPRDVIFTYALRRITDLVSLVDLSLCGCFQKLRSEGEEFGLRFHEVTECCFQDIVTVTSEVDQNSFIYDLLTSCAVFLRCSMVFFQLFGDSVEPFFFSFTLEDELYNSLNMLNISVSNRPKMTFPLIVSDKNLCSLTDLAITSNYLKNDCQSFVNIPNNCSLFEIQQSILNGVFKNLNQFVFLNYSVSSLTISNSIIFWTFCVAFFFVNLPPSS
ncbi:hypothetical protein GEMRC1_007524 [Eukaryota sp. GEM-RC1]